MIESVTRALEKKGVVLASAIAETLKNLKSEFGFNDGLAAAFLWTCISDKEVADTADAAVSVLVSFLAVTRQLDKFIHSVRERRSRFK